MNPPTFKCGTCGAGTIVEPTEGPAICPACCEKSEDGHDYQYERDERTWVCQHCGEFAPGEWISDMADNGPD